MAVTCQILTVFGRPFVKRFALCYRSVVSVLSVTLVYCGQTVGRIKTKLGTQVGLGHGHTALDRDPPTPPLKGHNPQFSAHICYGQMASWIKMPLGPGDFVLDVDPAPPSQKGDDPQIFGPCLLCQNGLTDQDDTWRGGRPRPRRLCVRWDPAPSSKRGLGGAPPQFSALLMRPNRFMDQDATWYRGRPWPR